jgi:predicted HNH restriction endonuclease
LAGKDVRTYEQRREYLISAVRKRRQKIRQMAIAAKGAKCEICGYDRCIEALEFHHLNESDKEFGLSEKGYARSWKKVENELSKCVLLCANCHRETHAEVAAPDGNVRMKNRVNSGKSASAVAEMMTLSQACSHRKSQK